MLLFFLFFFSKKAFIVLVKLLVKCLIYLNVFLKHQWNVFLFGGTSVSFWHHSFFSIYVLQFCFRPLHVCYSSLLTDFFFPGSDSSSILIFPPLDLLTAGHILYVFLPVSWRNRSQYFSHHIDTKNQAGIIPVFMLSYFEPWCHLSLLEPYDISFRWSYPGLQQPHKESRSYHYLSINSKDKALVKELLSHTVKIRHIPSFKRCRKMCTRCFDRSQISLQGQELQDITSLL